MKPKLKCHILMVAEYFPSGRPTWFVGSIKDGTKIHTIRNDYVKWKLRIDEINAGAAYLSVRYWRGKPKHSKQVEILRLYQGEVYVQKLYRRSFDHIEIDGLTFFDKDLCQRDGLSLQDFRDWFSHYSDKPKALIHFTQFRYMRKMQQVSSQRRKKKKDYNLVCRLRKQGIVIDSQAKIIRTPIAAIESDPLSLKRTKELLRLGYALQPNLFDH